MSLLKPHTSAPRVSTGMRIARRRAPPATVYDPKLLSTMLSAFTSACGQLPAAVRSCELSRSSLARRILVHVDRGERNAQRLAYLASNDLRRQIVAATRQPSDGGLGRSAAKDNFPSRSLAKPSPTPTSVRL
jgi:hypothetical protein